MARDLYSWTDKGIQRRSIHHAAFRLDGLGDLLPRMRGASVLDLGCNRGRACQDCVDYGATVVHGCDISKETDGTYVTDTANKWFADDRSVEARFEVCDLTGGPAALKKAFGSYYRTEYDFILMLAVYHKLRREMPTNDLLFLVDHLAHHCGKFFVWRGSREEKDEFEPVLAKRGFRRVHYSEISECACLPGETATRQQPAGIWAKTEAV